MQQPAPIRRLDNRGKDLRIARGRAAGFTLIELLVVMSILLILALITIRLVNTTLDSDRMKTGSRELQSYLAGARDRAIYAGQPRGVRFIPDQTDPLTVRSFVYIGAPTSFTDSATISIGPTGLITFNGPSTQQTWINLWNRGQLKNGAQIQLTVGSTVEPYFLTVSPIPVPVGGATAGQPFTITTVPGSGVFPISSASYQLQLAASILPSEQPRSLPRNIAIDLRTSVLPTNWAFPPSASSTFDVLFSPAGTVTGHLASSGRIHFVLADIADATSEVAIGTLSNRLQLNAPWQPGTAYVAGNVIVPTPSSFIAFRCTTAGTSGALAAQPNWPTQPNQTVTDSSVVWQSFVKKANTIVSLATSTGRITTHPVDVQDVLSTGLGYDTFRYAEIGEVTQ
jgi:prepilin-type N-terminal cleavage/methylation domain-containing protein